MKISIILSCITTFCLLTFSCKKEAVVPKLEAENTKITGDMTYKQTGLKVLTTTPEFTVQVTMEGEGTLNLIGKVKMLSTFTFNGAKGEGKDFVTSYTDASGNIINIGGTSKTATGKEFAVYITENAVSGTGRFAKITTNSGGISGATMNQDGTGKGRIEWVMTF